LTSARNFWAALFRRAARHARFSQPSRISTFLLWFSAFVVFAFIFFPQLIANLVADLLAGKS